MIPGTLFNIPMWSIPSINFKKKKPQLEKLCKAFPEKKHGIQTFSTNRQRDRSGFADAFNNIMGEELGMLSQKLEKDIQSIQKSSCEDKPEEDMESLRILLGQLINLPYM